MGEGYDPHEIEPMWQARWEADGLYEIDVDAVAPDEKFFNLVEFPYPSAKGLHVGHAYTYCGADVYGRFLDRCERVGLDLPILPGTRILRSRIQATRTAEKFGVTIPSPVRAALPPSLRHPEDADATARGVDCFLRLLERLRSLGAPGIHIFVTHTPTAAAAFTSLPSHTPGAK